MMNKNIKSADNPLILIVDDDLSARLVMRSSLEKVGYRVAEAEDGLVAISSFENLQPDAILLDVIMPNLDGYEACRAIRKLHGGENTPILMVTGRDDFEAIHRAYDSGATDFITKPVNWGALNYRIKYMLRASKAFHDVIDKQKEIHELAFFDHLTGLANRTLFNDTLEITLAESFREQSQLGLLFLDLDRFKTINDSLGHHVGDYLLKLVADRISNCIREADFFSRLNTRDTKHYISRLGGDEFTVMLPRLQNLEDAGQVAHRINKRLAEPFQLNEREIYISVSIGISIFPLDGKEAGELIKHADIAMYYAKEKGKNNFQYYKKSLNIKAREHLDFESDVHKAVQQEEFELYYQPQVDLQNGTIIGAEALARWHHQTRGPVSPGEFIPAIEELGLIIPFTDWVIQQIFYDQHIWQKKNLPETRIAFNVSSKQIVQQKIPQKIAKYLQDYSLNSSFLELELTESVLAEQNKETMDMLLQIKELGLSIAIDDFGTGYSSFMYLKNFPIDVVKIDRFFIKDILTSDQGATIVKAIIAMSHSMEMKVIAEGIEEQGQYDLLKQMDCDYGQGFLFSQAVNGDKFTKIILDGF